MPAAARVGGEREDLAGIAGGGDDAARRVAEERGDLPRRRRAPAASRGPDRRRGGRSCLPCRCRRAASRRLDQQIERPVVGRFPQRVPQAVGPDAEDRAPWRCAIGCSIPSIRRTRLAELASTTVMAVISAETVGTGARGGSGVVVTAGGRAIFAAGRAAERGGVDRPVGRELQRVDLLVRRVEEHERLAGLVDAEDPPGRLGAGNQVAALVDRERRPRWWCWSCRRASPCRRA